MREIHVSSRGEGAVDLLRIDAPELTVAILEHLELGGHLADVRAIRGTWSGIVNLERLADALEPTHRVDFDFERGEFTAQRR